MQTDSPTKISSKSRALRFVVSMLLVIGCGWYFFTRQNTFDTQSLSAIFLIVVYSVIVGFARERGYLKLVRSQDSWFRIIGVTIFIIVAGVLVSAVGILIVLKLR